MARGRVLTSFVVTLGVLTLLVALSLRNAGAQADLPTENTTLVANLPVAGMVKKEDAAAVHIVNLGTDHTRRTRSSRSCSSTRWRSRSLRRSSVTLPWAKPAPCG
jgi:hypothetical protein